MADVTGIALLEVALHPLLAGFQHLTCNVSDRAVRGAQPLGLQFSEDPAIFSEDRKALERSSTCDQLQSWLENLERSK